MIISEALKRTLPSWVKSLIGAAYGRPEEEVPADLNDLPRCGAFVTLHLEGRLRGCIGHIISDDPPETTLRTVARSAAFSDPRFPPLTEKEWERTEVEISLLSPMERIDAPEALEMGVHGALLESFRGRGLFLPQVAPEQGWDRETFMDHLCRKAGLPPEFWREGKYELYRFTAEIIK